MPNKKGNQYYLIIKSFKDDVDKGRMSLKEALSRLRSGGAPISMVNKIFNLAKGGSVKKAPVKSVTYKKGGAVKKNIGAMDYRKGGMVMSTSDNRRK
tara:strand:- start:1076 stop:1366 length:291 start_codon:yes stop_codon:yes gene_type:complete